MVTTDGAPDPAVEQLKARRRTTRAARRAEPPQPVDPITVRSHELNRPVDGAPVSLSGPTITPAVVTGPFAAPELHDYVTAEQDATENVIPRGCTTPVCRVMWHAGDRVQRAVHDAYQAARAQVPAD